jgi:hypothetical protein
MMTEWHLDAAMKTVLAVFLRFEYHPANLAFAVENELHTS